MLLRFCVFIDEARAGVSSVFFFFLNKYIFWYKHTPCCFSYSFHEIYFEVFFGCVLLIFSLHSLAIVCTWWYLSKSSSPVRKRKGWKGCKSHWIGYVSEHVYFPTFQKEWVEFLHCATRWADQSVVSLQRLELSRKGSRAYRGRIILYAAVCG